MRVHLNPRIIADLDILGGRPVVAGTQVTVSELVMAVAAGASAEDVAHEHGISPEDVRAALAYAAQRASEPVVAAGEPVAPITETIASTISTESEHLGLDPDRISPLGRQLIELRQQVIASGTPLISSWEDLDREIADIRGERYPVDDQ